MRKEKEETAAALEAAAVNEEQEETAAALEAVAVIASEGREGRDNSST